ncbi:ABC transporter permease [Lichenibacterium ramalinae]|uniref:ABC transporter permease n=2 Tax=Lichenibacterium ramalinae TaxID=2316527 RepID=A0A4V1RIV5_9HYPH|nr:ABC transporter permease [Lichenibacterium ramalinae]
MAARLGALLLLLLLVLAPQVFAPVLRLLTENGAPAIYDQGSLLDLTLDHIALVAGSTAASALAAVLLGILVTRPAGREFLPLSRAVVNVGQVFPPVAVLAIAVPLVGFGLRPTLIALVLYGLLPIFENTIAGLDGVSPPVMEAARGMGLGPRQRFLSVELPLALPVILAGIRLSTVINIGTATIGSTVAAKGLGEVILAGLGTSNTAFILQGGLIVGLLAVLVYDGLGLIEARLARRAGRV